MNELIKHFNEKYGDKYGKISYPRTTLQIYRTYQTIKSYGIKDEKLISLLHDIKLPKPKTIEEKELYADCLYNIDDSEIKNQLSNIAGRIQDPNPFNLFADNTCEKKWESNKYVYKSRISEEFKNSIANNENLSGKLFFAKVNLKYNSVNEETYSFEGKMRYVPDDISSFILYANEIPSELENAYISVSLSEDIATLIFHFSKKHSATIFSDVLDGKIEIIIMNDIIDTNNILFKNSPIIEGNISMGRAKNSKAGSYSVALGSNVKASGNYSFAEGVGTEAMSMAAHAEGSNTKACSAYSHAEGWFTVATTPYQHAQGKYNIEDYINEYAHVVGNGTKDKRSNAHTLDWNGNAWFAGDVYVKGDNQNNGKKLLSTNDIYFNSDGELVVTINGVTKTFTPKA